MKASIQATGGVLSLASTTYRHYLNNQTGANPITATHNVSTQVKSLKGLIVRPQNNALNGADDYFPGSTGQSMQIDSIQFKVGSILFPQEPIAFNADNPGEMYNEIRKCFGTIGSYNHGTMLNKSNFKVMTDAVADIVPPAGGVRNLWAGAYDFETFAKSATESGLNVADRALPVSFNYIADKVGAAGVKNAGNTDEEANQKIRYDTFAMCDCIIYIDLMGKITTRI